MIDRIAEERRIAVFLTDRLGGGWHASCVSARMKAGRVEAVFRAEGPDGRRLAIKQCAHPRKAINEFSALQALAAASSDCVRPVFLNDQASLFAMEWIEAPTIKQLMHQPSRLDLIRKAGRWLRALHRATRHWTPQRDPQIEGALLIDPQAPEFRRVNDRLRARRARLGIRFLFHSLLHSDFHMGNLFVVDGRAVAFDPLAMRRGTPMFDVADFLVLSEIYRLHAQTQGNAWPHCERRDRQAFLEGYGRLAPWQNRLLAFAMDVKIARMWHHHAKSAHRTLLEESEFALLQNAMRDRALLGHAP